MILYNGYMKNKVKKHLEDARLSVEYAMDELKKVDDRDVSVTFSDIESGVWYELCEKINKL